MSQDESKQPQSTIVQAKDYLRDYDGPVMTKIISLGDPVMKQIYKRDAPLCQRNALFVTYFARLTHKPEEIDPLEHHLLEILNKANKEFTQEIERLKLLFEAKDVGDLIANSQQVSIEAKVTSPLYRSFLDLIVSGDNLSTYYNTWWMHGHMESREFMSERLKIKKRIRGVNQFIRQTWLKLQNRDPSEKASEGDTDDVQVSSSSTKTKKQIESPSETAPSIAAVVTE